MKPIKLTADSAYIMWPELSQEHIKETALLFCSEGKRHLRLASNSPYEIWYDGSFIGSGGHRCARGVVEIDSWDATNAGHIWVRLQYMNPNEMSVWFRCLFEDPFLADLDTASRWSCYWDTSLGFAAKINSQLASQNVVKAGVGPGAPIELERVDRRDWVAVKSGIEPLRYVPVEVSWTDRFPGGGKKKTFEPHHMADIFANIRQGGMKSLYRRTYRLPLLGLHRVQVQNPQSTGIALIYSEVEDLNAVYSSKNRNKVHLADAIFPHVDNGAPIGVRGCKYIHVISARDSDAVGLSAWRQEYPLAWIPIDPEDSTAADILRACRNNLIACVDGGVVDTCWRERAQWVGDLRMSAIALRKLTTNGAPILERALEQIATSYEPATAMVQGAWPVKHPSYRGLLMPTYHLAYCLTVLRHSSNQKLRELVTDSLKTWHTIYRNENGLMVNIPGWYFVDWDSLDHEAADTHFPESRQRGRSVPHAVVNAWYYEACAMAKIDPGISPERLHDAFFDARTNGYSMYPKKNPGIHATAAMLGSVPVDRKRLEKGLSYIMNTPELNKRVTLYFGYFIAQALSKFNFDQAVRFVKGFYGPVARTYGTLYEKTNAEASMAHGWSVGIVDYLVP